MVLLSGIRGQNNALRYLSGNLRSGRIANGYLFVGPEGVGKALAARAFLAALFCRCKKSAVRGTAEEGNFVSACGECPSCVKISKMEHPDIMWIAPEKNKNIKIEDIRRAKGMVSYKPYEAAFSACVIEDAHMMTVEASNALLKVLEEPPGNSLFILISSKRELLLPTVISRCVEIRFNPLSVRETKDILMERAQGPGEEQKAVDGAEALLLASASEGSPGRAMELMDTGLLSRKKEISDLLEGIARGRNAKSPGWDREGKNELLDDLEVLIMFFRDLVMRKEALEGLILDKTADKEIFDLYKDRTLKEIQDIAWKLIGFRKALKGNINPKLVAQALPLELVR
jgi:DNA polymerase-3 subunit delta'